MKRQIWTILFICLLVACTAVTAPATHSSLESTSVATEVTALPPSSTNHLYQALSVMPENSNYVEFTDWALIKKKEGFEGLSSADDLDERIDFFSGVVKKYAIPSFYGIRSLQKHSELWGWDSSDLEWEVRSSINIHPNYVLKFRENFDLGSVISHLKEHGFKETNYQNISIYNRQMDTSLNLIKTTELSILNTAVIEEANLLVMSSDRDTVLLLLDTFQNRKDSLVDKESVQELIQSLGNTPGAFVSENVCSLLGSQALIDRLALDPLKDTKQREARRQLNSRPPLESYEALGIGYSLDGIEPIGQIILQFSDPETALKDLLPRQQLARTGSTRGEPTQPYSEVFFSLSSDPTVQGNQIVMEVLPVGNIRRLFDMVQRLDMSFATCP